jgi:AcrR family transcriptional regulator
MSRLTRAETQAQTRDHLIAAARPLFLREGYFATSLEKVADEAGYSKGAVYSNFASKDELCLIVLDQIRVERALEIATAAAAGTTLDERLDALQSWADRVLGDEGWSILEIEFATQVRRNPALREQVSQSAAAIRLQLAAVLRAFAAELDHPLPLAADELATALLSLGIGLGLQRAIDPELNVTVFTDIIRLLSTGTPPASAQHSADPEPNNLPG